LILLPTNFFANRISTLVKFEKVWTAKFSKASNSKSLSP
jgi:hypothetical protein